ncbi:hypothetical protein HZH68_013643 [Vespula germanica]|uniref:Uncharacterized protein n=1 Tax=Vespula germanica TaxID=30212 RepID=A0A834JDJ8_VESGE|nr:hypothetical protein HZH68_013643 [Vespula germanica]
MAPSTKKPKERKVAEHAKRNPYSRQWCCDCHCTDARSRLREEIDVQELIWKLLNITKHNQGRAKERATWPLSRRRMQRERSERYLRMSPFESVSISRASSESEAATLENLREATDAASSNSFVESIGPRSVDASRTLLNKRSILQVINNYIKAGIEEGKRQAKIYIRKALWFGVKSGYLIPADSQGQVLKVSPTLANSTRRIGRELRRKRLRARKLDDNDLETVQRKTRRNSFSRYTKKSREESTDSAVSRRNVQKSKRKRNVARLPKSDKDKPGRRPRKETRTGRIEKRAERFSKESLKERRTISKSASKGNVRNDLDLNDRNCSENEEKRQNKREVKEVRSEFMGCPIPKHRTFLLTDRESESRDKAEEGEKRGNNEDQLDDSVLKRSEG